MLQESRAAIFGPRRWTHPWEFNHFNNKKRSHSPDKSIISGCIIDAFMGCSDFFPDDTGKVGAHPIPHCVIMSVSVIYVSHLQVDRSMLAAYAGIATRNKGLNVFGEQLVTHPVAMNSVAAAFVMTRKVVPGTVEVEGVRASIDPWFVVLLLLPLIFLGPLFLFNSQDPEAKQVPRTVWDLLLFGRAEHYVRKKM